MKIREYRNSLTWLVLGVFVLLLRWLVPAASIESVYSRGIYQVVRMAIDFLLASWMPFAMLYLFLLVGLGLLIQRVRRWWRNKEAISSTDYLVPCLVCLDFWAARFFFS